MVRQAPLLTVVYTSVSSSAQFFERVVSDFSVVAVVRIFSSIPPLLPLSLRHQTDYVPLNLNRLQYLIDSGRIDASQPINMYTLQQGGAVSKITHGVKLLATVSSYF